VVRQHLAGLAPKALPAGCWRTIEKNKYQDQRGENKT
jgi:hypothetical protein